MQRRTPLCQRTPLRRTRPMRCHRKRLTAAERLAYQQVTERARDPEGFLRCEVCARPLLEREARRHHVTHRSQMGPTILSNLLLVCDPCHYTAHGERIAS